MKRRQVGGRPGNWSTANVFVKVCTYVTPSSTSYPGPNYWREHSPTLARLVIIIIISNKNRVESSGLRVSI